MRILFVVSGRNTPSTRYRILPFVAPLRAAGHRCDLVYSFPEKYDSFRLIGWRASQKLKHAVRHWHAFRASRVHYDTIVVEREVFDDDTFDLESKFRKATGHLVLDVDDGIFLRHERKFDSIAAMADVLISGNAAITEYCLPRAKHIVEIPTCLAMDDYPNRWIPPREDSRPPVIGWIGTPSGLDFLNVVEQPLRRLAQTHDFRVLLVSEFGGIDVRLLDGLPVERRNWNPARVASDLCEMDLGLMPLPADQPWMRYKCGFKLLQYLAVGAPAVASPIGVNAEILQGNQVGRSASDDDQWYQSLVELIDDVPLRQSLGLAGRQLVQQRYSVDANAGRFLRALTPA